MLAEISCEDVCREISNYADDGVDAALRRRMTLHLNNCRRCAAVLDGIRNVVQLVGDDRAFEVPSEFSKRLFSKLDLYLQPPYGATTPEDLAVGITEDRVPPGSHLIYFWENDDEFERGVRFLFPGLGRGEHCIAFGHDEALERVQQVLRRHGFVPEQLVRDGELTLLRRHACAETTLAEIGAVLQAAAGAGAKAVRFLGNLGMGRDPLPAGEDDVLQLEKRVDELISGSRCVVVCMYDVQTLPGRLILRGGLQQHRLSVCSQGVHENPYYLPESRTTVHVN